MTDFIFEDAAIINFHTFMQKALYHPKFGYYQQRCARQGRYGDYITSPTLSPLFARCLSHTIGPLVQKYRWPIAEIGPGTGHLTTDLLKALQQKNALPPAYHLVEPAKHSKNRQLQHIQTNTNPDLAKLCHWSQQLPDNFSGIVIANEILDAMPVHLLETNDQCDIFSVHVALENHKLFFQRTTVDIDVLDAFKSRNIPIHPNYRYEISLAIPDFIAQLGQSIQQGLFLIVDYGYPRTVFYHPERDKGTLCSFQRQTTTNDILKKPGYQDISCHVDFTLVAESAVKNSFTVDGYTTQERFLIANDIQNELLDSQSQLTLLEYQQYKKTAHILTHPYEMGETMKVLSLSKGLDDPADIYGFRMGCHTHQL